MIIWDFDLSAATHVHRILYSESINFDAIVKCNALQIAPFFYKMCGQEQKSLVAHQELCRRRRRRIADTGVFIFTEIKGVRYDDDQESNIVHQF